MPASLANLDRWLEANPQNSMLVLRDLLGRSSVLTTEKYLKRLDTTRIYRQAYETAGAAAGLVEDTAARREADAEFDGPTDEKAL